MKNSFYSITALALFLFSCNVNKENNSISNEAISIKELIKLKELMMLPNDSVLVYYDLSDDSLTEIPDLSLYTILSLDLSHNQIDAIVTKNLPKKLERLNLSHNSFLGFVEIDESSIPNLKEIDMSYNRITVFRIFEPVQRLILSHNELNGLWLNQSNFYYLDISYNPNFSNRTTTFAPDEIDTIVRKGIANDRMLYNPRWYNGGPHLYSDRIIHEKMIDELDKKYGKIYSDSVEYRKVERRHRRN